MPRQTKMGQRRAKLASVLGNAIYANVPCVYTRMYTLRVYFEYPTLEEAINRHFQAHLAAATAAGIFAVGGSTVLLCNFMNILSYGPAFKSGFLGYFATVGNEHLTAEVAAIIASCKLNVVHETGDWE